MMLLVDEEDVRELVRSPDPDAALVFTHGACAVVSLAEIIAPDTGLLIATRRDLLGDDPGTSLTDERIHALAHCLDNRARDLGS